MSDPSNIQNPNSQLANNPSTAPSSKLKLNNLNYSGMSEYFEMTKKPISNEDPTTAFANKRSIVYGKNCSFLSSTPMPNYEDSFDSASTGYSSECGSTSAFTPIQTPEQNPAAVPRFNHGKRNAAPPVPYPRTSMAQNRIDLQALMELQMFENQTFIKEKQQSQATQELGKDSANSSGESSTFLGLSKINISSSENTTLENVSRNLQRDATTNSSEEGQNSFFPHTYANMKMSNTSQPAPNELFQNIATPQSSQMQSSVERPMGYFDPLKYLWAMDEPHDLRKEAERALVYFDPVKQEMVSDDSNNSAALATAGSSEQDSMSPKIINAPPNLIEGLTASSSTQNANANKCSKIATKKSQKLIYFGSESESESEEEDGEDEQERNTETTKQTPTTATSNLPDEETNVCKNSDSSGASGSSEVSEGPKKSEEIGAIDLPEDTGECLEPDEDGPYDQYDENLAKMEAPNCDKKTMQQTGKKLVQSQITTTNNFLMQPLPNGYVPLDDLWERPWFDMKATSKSAEELLLKFKKNGSFIVRNSKDRDGRNFALSFYSKFLNGGTANHLKISFLPTTSQWKLGTMDGDFSTAIKFNTVSDCINYYIMNGFTLENGLNVTLKKTFKKEGKKSIGGSISKTVKKEIKLIKP